MPLTKAQRAAKEKEARAASMFASADPVLQAELESGPLSEEEKERIEQAAEAAQALGVY